LVVAPGSEPGGPTLRVGALVRFQLPELNRTEVIRPDEEPALKTGGGLGLPVSSSLTASADGPVVQRYDVWLTSRKRWFDSFRDYSPEYANGRAVRLKPECLQVRLLPWALRLNSGMARLAIGRPPWLEHRPEGLVAGMLSVRVPPELLRIYVLVEQPGVLATLSRWRSWVQIPPGTLFVMKMARYANR
jgi:hypothetical protein